MGRNLFAESQGRNLFAITPPQPQPSMMDNLGYLGQGVGQGIQQLGQGVGQLGLEAGNYLGLVGDKRLRQFNQGVEADRRQFEQSPAGQSGWGSAGQFIGENAPLLAIPGGVAGSLARRAAVSGLQGGLIGGTQYVPEGGNRLQNMASGAAGGAIAAPIMSGVGSVLAKGGNAIRGRMRPDADELARLSAEHGVPLSAGDIRQTPTVNMMENRLGRLPVIGMSKFRKRQGEAATQAAQSFRERFARNVNDDTATLTQQALHNQFKREKRKADMYFKSMARKAGDQKIPTGRMNRYAQEVIDAELKKKPEYQDNALIESMKKYTTDPEQGFMGLRDVRTDIQSEVAKHYTGNSVIGSRGVHHMQKLKKALDEDMEQYAVNNGNLSNAWKRYNEQYRNKVRPYEDERDIRAALNELNPDEIHARFIKAGKPSRAKRFYDRMDEQGRAAVRLRIIDDALEKATSGKDTFSPAKFAGELERLEAPARVFFQGQDNDALRGFVKLMRHAEKGGQALADPPTGQELTPYLVGGGLATVGNVAGVGAAIGLAGLTKATSLMFTTRAGKRVLLAASKAKGKTMDQVAARATKLLANQAPKALENPGNQRPDATRRINGRTYVRINGAWYEE